MLIRPVAPRRESARLDSSALALSVQVEAKTATAPELSLPSGVMPIRA